MENEFEWDENKDVLNYQKHHLHFEDVIYVFADKYRLERADPKEEKKRKKERRKTIGKVGDVVFVAFTERKSKIRLISARLATAHERRLYYGNSDFTAEGWECALRGNIGQNQRCGQI